MNRNRNTFFGLFVVSVLHSLCIIACQKDAKPDAVFRTNGKHLSVYLTSNNEVYDSVLLDILKVEANADTTSCVMEKNDGQKPENEKSAHTLTKNENGIWYTLSVDRGVYNIASFKSDKDDLLASGNIKGKINKINITLGPESSVFVRGVRHLLNFYSQEDKTVTVAVNKADLDEFGANQTGVQMNFDVRKSIQFRGGKYFLQPVIQPSVKIISWPETGAGFADG